MEYFHKIKYFTTNGRGERHSISLQRDLYKHLERHCFLPSGFNLIFYCSIVSFDYDNTLYFGTSEIGDYLLGDRYANRVILDNQSPYISGDALRRRILGEQLLFENDFHPNETNSVCLSSTVYRAMFFVDGVPTIGCTWDDGNREWESMTVLCLDIDDLLKKTKWPLSYISDSKRNGDEDNYNEDDDHHDENEDEDNCDEDEDGDDSDGNDEDVTWGGYTTCDICGKEIEDVLYDARRPSHGLEWATMCEECFFDENATLGIGCGQKYMMRGDGEFHLVAGMS